MLLNYPRFLQTVLDIGESMQNSGAEVSRIEDSIHRICAAYGILRVNAFTITSNIIVTLEIDSETVITQTRRIYPSTNNFTRLDQLNNLCRYICSNTPSIDEMQQRYQAIISAKASPAILSYAGAILAGSAFTIFFGGNLRDAFAAALLSVLIEFVSLWRIRFQIPSFLYLFFTSFISGLCGILLVRIGLGIHLDKILIGCIMLIIPGISITNSLRDLLSGDTVSGIARLSESLLQAGGIAGGFFLSIYLLGRGI